MFDCDLHTHSRFFHCAPEVATWYDPYGVRAARWVARSRGLDGIAVTNHDFYRASALVDDGCIPGIEVSTTAGHLLVVGPDPPARTEPGAFSPHEAVALARERGCATVVAHPFRNSTLLEYDADYDAVEVNGKHPEHHGRIVRVARDRDLAVVGGSDAHFPFEVARVSTRIDADVLTPTAVVDAIRDGRVEPAVRDGRLLRALGAVYDRLHRERGHL